MTPPKRRRREYSPEQKAASIAVLASCGGNTRAAARQLAGAGQRVPEATLRGWARQPMAISPEEAELVDEAKRSLETILESIATKIAHGLDKPDALARILSKPVQAATVMGITADKLVALRKGANDESKMSLSEFLSLAKWAEDVADSDKGQSPRVADNLVSTQPARTN